MAEEDNTTTLGLKTQVQFTSSCAVQFNWESLSVGVNFFRTPTCLQGRAAAIMQFVRTGRHTLAHFTASLRCKSVTS